MTLNAMKKYLALYNILANLIALAIGTYLAVYMLINIISIIIGEYQFNIFLPILFVISELIYVVGTIWTLLLYNKAKEKKLKTKSLMTSLIGYGLCFVPIGTFWLGSIIILVSSIMLFIEKDTTL